MREELNSLEVDQTKLAWAAGFFDGEGCVAALEGKTRTGRLQHQLFLDATQSSIPPLSQLADIFGGRIHPDRPRLNRLTRRPIFHWRLYGAARVAHALASLLPYLVVKRPQAEAALELADTFRRRTPSPSLIERRRHWVRLIQSLNSGTLDEQ